VTDWNCTPTRWDTQYTGLPNDIYYDKGYYNTFGWYPAPDISKDAAVDAIAIGRFRSKIAAISEQYKALVPIGELKDLRSLVKSMTSLTEKLVVAIIELKRTKGRSLAKLAGDLYLTWSFGIRPMMGDLKGLADSLWAFLMRKVQTARVSASARTDWYAHQKATGQGGKALRCPLSYDTYAKHELSIRYIAGWKFDLYNGVDYTAADHFGLTPPNFVPAAWKLLPFSWLTDYFLTIGDFLDDVFTSPGGQPVFMVKSRKYTLQCDGAFRHSAGTDVKGTFSDGKYHLHYVEFDRTPLVNLPTRPLRIRSVDEIAKNGVSKLLNLVSLAAQIEPAKPPKRVKQLPYYRI